MGEKKKKRVDFSSPPAKTKPLARFKMQNKNPDNIKKDLLEKRHFKASYQVPM